MAHDVVLRTVPARPTAIIAATTTWREYPDLWPGLLSAVHAAVTWPADGRHKGRNVMLYLDDTPHVEVGVELDREAAVAAPAVRSALPAGDTASTTHTTGYADMGDAHRAVVDWCAANGRTLAGPRWEIYGHVPDDDPSVAPDIEITYLLVPPP